MAILAVFYFGVGIYRKKNEHTIVRIKMWGIYLIYIIVITSVSYLFRKQHIIGSPNYIIRMIKNIFYITFTLFISWKGYFELKYAVKYYGFIAMLATVVIYIQCLCYVLFQYDFAGYNARWVYTEGYKYRASNLATGIFRPTSIFCEPAHYFEYVSILLILYLFYSKDRKTIRNACLISAGVVLSTSGQGIIFTAMLWGIWLWKEIKRFRWEMTLKKEKMLPLFFLFLAMLFLVLSDFGKQAISRILSPAEATVMIGGRIDGYVALKKLSIDEVFFGTGYGNYMSVFFSSWSFNIYCLGIIGTGIIIFLYVYCFKHSDKKMIVVINALMSIFSNVFMGHYFVFFFSFILTKSNENSNKYIREQLCQKVICKVND